MGLEEELKQIASSDLFGVADAAAYGELAPAGHRPADFLESADYVQRVAKADSDLIDRIKSTRDSVQSVEDQLSEQKRQQMGLFEQEDAKKAVSTWDGTLTRG